MANGYYFVQKMMSLELLQICIVTFLLYNMTDVYDQCVIEDTLKAQNIMQMA